MTVATAGPRRTIDFESELDAVRAAARSAKGVSTVRRSTAQRLAQEGFAISVRLDETKYRSEAALSAARRLALESRAIRAAGTAAAAWPRYFVVHGRIEGERVRASWFCGSLHATSALRSRGELLVSMGETFCVDRGKPVVPASLVDPLAAMLTLIRSCDELDDASFGPLHHERSLVRLGSS